MILFSTVTINAIRHAFIFAVGGLFIGSTLGAAAALVTGIFGNPVENAYRLAAWVMLGVVLASGILGSIFGGMMRASDFRWKRLAQKKLRDKGFYKGPLDGRLNPKTKEAIMRFQSTTGLATTCKLDEETLKSLGL
jgi:hypothetical protein